MCKKKCKQISIVIKYENINTKEIEQGYGTQLNIILVWNILKVMGTTFIYMPLGFSSSFCEGFHVPIDRRSLLRNFLVINKLLINQDLTESELIVNYESTKD